MYRTSRLLPVSAILLLLVACQDPTSTSTESSIPAQGRAFTAGAQASGLVRDFAFLPPVVTGQPKLEGRFDAAILPDLAVEVCEWTASGCAAVVARFTAAGQGDNQLRRVGQAEHYHVNWRTGNSGLQPNKTYRLRSILSGMELGSRALKAGRNGGQLRDLDAQTTGVVIGQTLPIRFWVSKARLAGDPSSLAAGALPQLLYTARPEDFTTDHPDLPGFPLTYNTLMLILRREATTGEANGLLNEIDATIVGSIPGSVGSTSGILFLRVPATNHPAMERLLARLRQDPLVRAAVQDATLTPDVVSQDNSGTPAAWTWDLNNSGGNWGLEMVRAPQMWNLNDAISKQSFVPGLFTAVLDNGFANTHEDLPPLQNQTPGIQGDHGTHVAGTIGARFDNGLGVDGINPFARLVVRAVNIGASAPGPLNLRQSFGEAFVSDLDALIRSLPEIRVVNVSLAYNWHKASIDTDVNAAARALAAYQGLIFRAMLETLEASAIPLPILAVAAGNESGKQARHASPMANAGLVHGAANIVVVEAVKATLNAINRETTVAAFSNVGGHLSAPGEAILSTVLGAAKYGLKNGTSMATPHVTGLLGFLYRLDPSLPRPTLTSNPLRDLLLANAEATLGGAQPRIDAFATVMDVDRVQGSDRVLRMLVDIDDGTLDGNQRTNANGSNFTDEDADGDGGPGDGQIDMSDFRRWRDWALQVTQPNDHVLDGGPLHSKKDANGDGVAGSGAVEDVFPRGDFNGDGEMYYQPAAKRKVPGVMGNRDVTDLEVLQQLFNDPHYNAASLSGLIESGDLEIDASNCLAAGPTLRSSVRRTADGVVVESRTHQAGAARHIYTLATDPANPADYIARVEVLDAAGQLRLHQEQAMSNLLLGEDRRWMPECASDHEVQILAGVTVNELPACTDRQFQGSTATAGSLNVARSCVVNGTTFSMTGSASTPGLTHGTLSGSISRSGGNATNMGGNGTGRIIVRDRVLITAPGLDGQQGTFRMHLELGGTLTTSPCVGFFEHTTAEVSVRGFLFEEGSPVGQLLFVFPSGRVAMSTCGTLTALPGVVESELVTFTYGIPFTLTLDVGAASRYDNGSQGSDTSASHSVQYRWLGMSGLDAGALVTSSTGVDWSRPGQ